MRVVQTYLGQERLHEFAQPEVIIGRKNSLASTDLDLSTDLVVSRTHARLWLADGHWRLEDLNSKSGTFVNGVHLSGPCQLRAGDVIRVGETTLRVEVEVSPPTAVPVLPGSPVRVVKELPPPEEKVETALDAEDSSFFTVAAAKSNSRERLALLLELPLLFGALSRVEDLLQLVIQRTLHVIPGAERGAVLLRNGHELRVLASIPAEAPAVSATLAARVLREARGFIWRRLVDGVPSQTVRELKVKTGMYAPMLWQGKILGVICVDNLRRDGVFTEDDLRLLLAVGQYAAQALANQADKKE